MLCRVMYFEGKIGIRRLNASMYCAHKQASVLLFNR